jgi:hypothetical protein
MSDQPATKVVIKQSILPGSPQPEFLQRVAVVYIDGEEYRVSAPPEARGLALEWIEQWRVTQLVGFNDESEVHNARGLLALKLVRDELQKEQKHAHRRGRHPDSVHYSAQICLKGHVQHDDGTAFAGDAHCSICGERCIDECPHCSEPIRGRDSRRRNVIVDRPLYCHRCGRAYPWMQDALDTARELLNHDEKLTLDDRNELSGLLQYVMSDPKGELAAAKRTLIKIKIEKAAQATREFVLDLMAKFGAEMVKSTGG